jgi:UDP-glucose-4-epimerase GalE
MTILVTGGAGYIGSHTVRLLQERGRDVVVLDTMEFGHQAAIGETPLVVGDVADGETVARIIRDYGVEAVVHFAGYKAAGESMERPGKYFQNNVAGGAVFLETLAAAGVDRLVFSSSCAVYGTAERVPVNEGAPIHPESPYGESKAIFERFLDWYDRCLGLHSVSLRYFNAAGAWPDGSIGEDWTVTLNLVPLIMKSVLGRREALQVFGTDYPTADGTAIRDYVHVVDLADAHLKALELLEKGGSTTAVNLGTGIGSSVLEVIAAA